MAKKIAKISEAGFVPVTDQMLQDFSIGLIAETQNHSGDKKGSGRTEPKGDSKPTGPERTQVD